MNLTIQLPLDIEASPLEQARSVNLDVSDYVQKFVHGLVIKRTSADFSRPARELSIEQHRQNF